LTWLFYALEKEGSNMAHDLTGWYPIAELAEMFGVTVNALDMFRKHHDIRGRRIGRNVLLRLDDLTEFKVSLGTVVMLMKEGKIPA
jgi:hypothetical protein